MGNPPTMYVAQRVLANLEKLIGSKGSIAEIGCSHINQSYELYVHFDVPPEPKVVVQSFFKAFEGIPTLVLDMVNPFTNKSDAIGSCKFDAADHALKVLKQNQDAIKAKVTSGAEFSLIKCNPLSV